MIRSGHDSRTLSTMKDRKPYVLITAAHNEEAHIGKAISSVVSQTMLPERWVIVSDGSSDRTDEIVSEHAKTWDFIQLLRLEKDHRPDFASKVHALHEGHRQLGRLSVEFVGHLDGDVSFGSSYFGALLERFEHDPKLGIAGGDVCEWDGLRFSPRPMNSTRSVPGAVQMFRRQCYESLGGFLPLKWGGEDWCAEITARMNGWRVQSFPDLPVHHHHRPTDGLAALLRRCYRGGVMDFTVGSRPLFEIARLTRRLPVRPPVLGALVRLSGYAWAACCGEKRIVSEDFVTFLRREEMERLRRMGTGCFWKRRPANISPLGRQP